MPELGIEGVYRGTLKTEKVTEGAVCLPTEPSRKSAQMPISLRIRSIHSSRNVSRRDVSKIDSQG